LLLLLAAAHPERILSRFALADQRKSTWIPLISQDFEPKRDFHPSSRGAREAGVSKDASVRTYGGGGWSMPFDKLRIGFRDAALARGP
jgi:hypothetical protein